jgi:hypothetical protein
MGDQQRDNSARVSRRKVAKGAAAATGAVAASVYIKPELRALGVSQAQAVSPGGEDPPPPPEPEFSRASSLSLSVSADATPGTITGQVCVSNQSDDGGAVEILTVTVLVQPKPFGGQCGNPSNALFSRSSTGGSNPLGAGTIIPGPEDQETCFTVEINDALIQNVVNGDDFRVHVVVTFGGHHTQGTRDTQVCTTVDV